MGHNNNQGLIEGSINDVFRVSSSTTSLDKYTKDACRLSYKV